MYIDVEIVQWDKHQPRKDIKHPTWFALSNRILEDAKLFDLTDAEWKALLYVFCQASQQNSAKVTLTLSHARRVCEIQEKTLRSALDKLAYAGVTCAYAIRTDALRDTTLQTDTTDKTDIVRSSGDSPHPFAEVWNSKVTTCPKADRWTPSRDRKLKAFLKTFNDADFANICDKVQASDFLSGRSGKWGKCGLDWVLKPDNATKILEGNYDNTDGPAVITGQPGYRSITQMIADGDAEA